MGYVSGFVGGVIDVVELFGSSKLSHSQFHSSYESGVYEIVGGATVHQTS